MTVLERHDPAMTSATSTSLSAAAPTAHVRPPAKLNLFLELLARRDDGFHEIDTVMVPIDWCDSLELQRIAEPVIRLQVDWMPSVATIQRRLHAETNELDVPRDHHNLVHRALTRFNDSFELSGGFACRLRKSIPAGAGMGGASSDAAAALRSAASLSGVPLDNPALSLLAAEIGSDVPFFLGFEGDRVAAARARGRGERLSGLELGKPLHVVVVFPNISLSTAKVYIASRVPQSPRSAERLIGALRVCKPAEIGIEMMNRLSGPAQEIAPRISEILKSMWRSGLRTCQLTGSGSACFAIANSAREAKRAASRLRAVLEPGAMVTTARTIRVPPPIEIR